MCGTPVCGSCSHEHAGRTFCSDGTHPALLESHTRLGDYVSQFEADWVHRNFINEGVRSAMFGFRADPGFYGLILPVEASVFVHKEDEARARSLMERYADEQGA